MKLAEATAYFKALSQNSYPGRGIIIGRDETAQFLIQVYWIMGRSENSRNRIFQCDPGTGRVFTQAANPAAMKDPALIIYDAMVEKNGVFAVSNGAQTNDIAQKGFGVALNKWSYEPDSPNFTPRIFGECRIDAYTPFALAIIRKSQNAEPERERHSYRLRDLPPGYGVCITTYTGDGNPLPSFKGEPYPLPLSGDIKNVADTIWEALNPDNRVSLVVKFIDISSGRSQIEIINKFTEVV